jgi:hypothetical protein
MLLQPNPADLHCGRGHDLHHRPRLRRHRRDPALGSVGFENATNERGERYVWLAPNVVDRLTALRGPGESYGDVISRIAAEKIGGDP